MLANKALSAAPSAVPVYVEDVFSTYLYTGNGSTQTITNNIDLSTKGGIVWQKRRNGSGGPFIFDTNRGAGKGLRTSDTGAEIYSGSADGITSFNADGFSINNTYFGINTSSETHVTWTFAQQEKFFDVVTYTGNGTARTISHNLGSVPGCIIIKRTDTSGYAWCVYHRALGTPASNFLFLNTTDGTQTGTVIWNNTAPTSTVFSLGNYSDVNANGGTYVAYLFAHDAGGFGASGSDNVISCGSYTGNGTAGLAVTLGYEPQWVIIKCSSAAQADGWIMVDTMRGLDNTANQWLIANSSNAESAESARIIPTATGFTLSSNAAVNTSGATYIYIAIRRGPMKTPTSGTSVFSPVATSASTGTKLTTGFPVDMQMAGKRAGDSDNMTTIDRLRKISTNSTANNGNFLETSQTVAENSGSVSERTLFWDNTGFQMPGAYSGDSFIFWNFRRAPGFFDVVCYTGTGSNTTVTHNLGVAPELLIVKGRTNAQNWAVYAPGLTSSSYYLVLNLNNAEANASTIFNSTAPTSSVFSVGTSALTNSNGVTYVAYMFASVNGVSKVGTYTGNGTNQTIDCGFTAGARFVLIKRITTGADGNWVVFDTARGIVSGSDPFLRLNTTGAEVTNEDAVDTANSGFIVNETTEALNTNSIKYLFLAIA